MKRKLAALGALAIAVLAGCSTTPAVPMTTAQATAKSRAIVASTHLMPDLAALAQAANDHDLPLAQADAAKVGADARHALDGLRSVRGWPASYHAAEAAKESALSELSRCMGAVSSASSLTGLLGAISGSACQAVSA